MKNILIAIIAVAIFSACSINKNEANKLGLIDVEIPTELKDNQEITNYIEGMEDVANSYAELIDNIFEDVGEYAGMDESELGMMDKMKLLKATGEVAIKSTEIMGKWSEYITKRAELEQQLSDAELEALNQVWKQFELRMEEIQKKYESDFQKNNENEL